MQEVTVSDPMTWQEICQLYPDEWVTLVETDWVNDRDFDFRSARVAGHSKRRRNPTLDVEALFARYGEIGQYFTGKIRAPFSKLMFL